jgi:drug/metabolite transporter (DMT)-like permease
MGIVEHDFHEFLLMKEWSFASIVLYGVTIRKLIKLKIEVQLAPRSPKLDAGVQFYVLLVILAAVVLAFVILAEFKRVSPVNAEGLEFAQMALFGLSLLSVGQAVWYEEIGRR